MVETVWTVNKPLCAADMLTERLFALREKLQKMWAKRDTQAKVRHVPYGKIQDTELQARIPAEFLNKAEIDRLLLR